MKFFSWGVSDVGRKREHNEDSFLVEPRLGLYAVADGMGGHQAGEKASRMAIEILGRELDEAARTGQLGDGEGAASRVIRASAQTAGAAIYDAAQANPEMTGMGTTLTALLIHGGRAHLAHVGDSRCYLYRDGKCQQLTDDHSWVSEQVRAGLLSESEALESKFKHVITRSVGFEREVLVDGKAVAVQPGDCFVLCSDGLTNYLGGDEIAKIMASHFFRSVASLLVEIANDRGGEDNVTVVLVHAANDATPLSDCPPHGETPPISAEGSAAPDMPTGDAKEVT